MLGGLALHQHAAEAFPALSKVTARPFAGNPKDEQFWRQVRQAFAASPNLINLNNGGVCPTPRATMDALDYYNRMCSEAPSYYMWRILDLDREPLRARMAALAGVSEEEIAFNRNATEALNTIIFGLPLKSGDEVVLSKYDYPNMINAWKQRAARDGIKLVWVELELPSENADYLANAYIEKFNDRTRLVHITHVINWSGQILPVAAIAKAARVRGIESLVDGAHAFALIDHQVSALGADYWGTSLHKWLCAPYGTGMLYVAKDKISKIWPLLGNDNPESENIRKFESLGTRSFPTEMAIGYSLDLHNMIGAKPKQERLHYLKNYWMDQIADLPGIQLYTSRHPDWGCAIGVFGFEGKKSTETAELLFQQHKIHTVGIAWEKINGVRVTPNVYTLTEDLDRFIKAVRKMAGS